jgi:hypothetical protein
MLVKTKSQSRFREPTRAEAALVFWRISMLDQDAPDPKFDVMTSRLLRREALRRAAEALNTASPLGLEDALARISAEVTAEALYRHGAIAPATTSDVTGAPLSQKNPDSV